MHKTGHFSIKEITKIEGHTNLDVELKDGKVERCELSIYEGQRFFEQMLIGRHFSQIPLIVSRICGFCSISHLGTSIEAIEKAFSEKPSDQTMLLRELGTNAEFLKSHALHLMLLVLPDFLGKESALEFTGKDHKYIHWALNLKKLGTDIIKVLGGRVYQTVNIRPGGFTLLPKQAALDRLLADLKNARKTAIEVIALFASFKDSFAFERKTEYVGLVGSQYCLLCGKIHCSDGTVVEEEDYLHHVKEFVVPYSAAKQASFNGREYQVGAQARINLNQKELCGSVKEQMKTLSLKFPSHKIYYNNVAQALELLQCIESSIETLETLILRKEALSKIKPSEAEGIGATEAPRGILFHHYSFDKKGFIKKADIIVPTLQNNHNIESDLKEFIPSLLELPQEKANLEIEKLIRAYDPCISCSTHFLKVNWNKK
jgi:coenzyme F420-reducing hydrogenase alpha subunit